MADETNSVETSAADKSADTAAPAVAAAAPVAAPAVKAEPAKEAAEPKAARDPMVAQLVAAQRELEKANKALEAERARVKEFERGSRKQAILSGLYDAGLKMERDELRGLVLVAAEDGKVDLYHEDSAAQVKAILDLVKARKPAASAAAPTTSLGGTPGSQGKPPTSAGQFLI